MLIGHLPAGRLAPTEALGRLGVGERLRRRLLTAGLVASVAPDLDLLYFYGVEIALAIAAVVVWRWRRRPDPAPRRTRWIRLGVGLAAFALVWAWLTYRAAPPAPDHAAIEAVVSVPLDEPTFLAGSPLQQATDTGRLWWTLYRLPIPNETTTGTLGDAWVYSFEVAGTYASPSESPLECHIIPEGGTTCGGVWNGHTVLVHHASASGRGTATVTALPG